MKIKKWKQYLFLLAVIFVIYSCDALPPLPDEIDGPEETLELDTLNGKWFVGNSAPTSTLGVNGDLYLDSDTGIVYLKVNDGWTNVADISGPSGEDGSAWISGSGIPSPSIGENGDFYFDAVNENVYEKSNDTWINIANISGSNGTDGTDGVDGTVWHSGNSVPTDTIGGEGDFYLNTLNGAVYEKQSTGWVFVINIIGQDGTDGQDGADGQDGSMWFSGSTVPDNSLGSDNDFYLDTSQGVIYQKSSDQWISIIDITGTSISDGITWHSGSGAPADILGSDGDLYLNIADGTIHLKSDSTWLSIGDITSSTGDDGTVWLTGVGAPISDLGINGDLYLDTATGDVYQKDSDIWSSIANIIGPKGDAGSMWLYGAGSPSDSLGTDGDFYLDTNNGDIYEKDTSTWVLITNITGPQGDEGASWLYGTGVPSDSSGQDGDLYLNTVTGDVYQKQGGIWSIIANIAGPPGDDGSGWLYGEGIPSDTIGYDDDFYLDTSNGDVYNKQVGNWVLIANITGPPGTDGVDLNVNAWVDTITTVKDTSYMIALRSETTGELILIGSGVAIDSNTILTNAHVYIALLSSYILYEQSGINVTPIAVMNGETAYGTYTYPLDAAGVHAQYDPDTVFCPDIAFLTTQSALPSSMDLPEDSYIRSASVGQDIGSLGYPQETGSRISYIANATFKDGVVSSLTPFDATQTPTVENTQVLQHNLDTTGGTSGSPIFDQSGKLLAINNSGAGRYIWDDSAHDFIFVPMGAIGYGIRADVVNAMFATSDYISDTISSWYIPDRYLFVPGDNISLHDGSSAVNLGTTMSTAQSAANSLFGKSTPDYVYADGSLAYSDNTSYSVVLLKSSTADILWSIFITDIESSIYLSPFRDRWGISIGASRTYILDTYGYGYSNAFSTDGTVYYYNYSSLGVGFGFRVDEDYDWNCDTIQIALSGYLSMSQATQDRFLNPGIEEYVNPNSKDKKSKLPLEVQKIMK